MKRRAFLLSTGGAAAGMLLLPRLALAEAGRIDWYTASDQNILDFWTNVVQPAFEAANPGVTLNLVDAGDAPGNIAIGERALAALSSNADPQADYFESYDPRLPSGAIDAGLFVNIKEAGLSNYSKINPLAIDTDYSVPYRGSQVLLAFDTTKLDPASAPKTFADLVAWIKANPGQFIYNRPDKGGSGGNFVRRAIYEVNGKDPAKFTVDNFTPEAAEAALTPAWDLLRRPRAVAVRRGRLHLGQHPVAPAPQPVGGHHDPGLVGPGAAGDRHRRAAGDHRPRAARPTSACPAASRAASCSRTASTRTPRSSSPTSS